MGSGVLGVFSLRAKLLGLGVSLGFRLCLSVFPFASVSAVTLSVLSGGISDFFFSDSGSWTLV